MIVGLYAGLCTIITPYVFAILINSTTDVFVLSLLTDIFDI